MSYSRRDDAVMRRIVTFLRQQGIKVWVDNEKLIPGTPIWEVEIEKAIKNAPAIVVVLSPDSKGSEWVRREISLADQYQKRVFPVLVRGDEKTSVSLRLIGRQFADIRKNEEVGLNSVSASLLRYLQELDAQELNAQKEYSRLAAQKTRNEKKLKKQKAEENIGRVSSPTNANVTEIPSESLTYPLTAPEKEDLPPTTAEIYNRSYKASYKATQALLSKLKIPAVVLVIGFIGYFLWQGISSLIPAASPTAMNTPQAMMIAAPTQTKTPVPTKVLTPTLTLEPQPGSTLTGAHGETLVYVPAGEFTMGSEVSSDEQPIHTVYLDAFWIDQFEVTNKQYLACTLMDLCERPSSNNFFRPRNYYENPEFYNYPVLYLTWDKANRYCEVWAGGDLPTEAQWEKAARGTDQRTYPWGEGIDCNKANYFGCQKDTTKVGSYESGKSPYNAYDMAGNVWEWVNDYYQSDYYYYADNASNPQGPTSSDYRVLRGGSWLSDVRSVRSAARWYDSSVVDGNIGFRCARSLP